jgi:hypothetical protein
LQRTAAARQIFSSLLLATCIFSSTLLAGTSSAGAAETHVFETSFGPSGTGASAFEQPAAVGVDQSTGDVYVADYAAGTVQKFNATHEPTLFTGAAANISGSMLTGFSFRTTEPESEIAVNSASHDFYVVNNPTLSLRAYEADGEPADFSAGPGAGTNEIGGFSEICGVAVDANGDIYVSDFFEGVRVYAPSGEILVAIPATAGAAFCNVAVDAHGTVYMNHFEGTIEKFTPSTFPVTASTTYTAGGPVDENVAWGLAVDPATNRLYVDEHNEIAEYNEAGARVLSFAAKGPGALTASEGLAVNAGTGQVYVSDAEGKRQVEVFGPAVQAPEVVTGVAEEVKPRSARLDGTVNPGGINVTECTFEYGETESYGHTAPCAEGLGEGPGEIGKGSTEVSVHADLSTLQPGATYHFRLRAATEGAGFGEDAHFATQPPPTISGFAASNLTESSVDLSAAVDPGGVAVTACRFEYGTGPGYGQEIACPTPPGAGTSPVPETVHIETLEHDTTYHWRVVATTEAGTTASGDHTFIYSETGRGLPDDRAYEMVTPPQKNGALIGDVTFGLKGDVADDGSRVTAVTIQCFAEPVSCDPERQEIGVPYAFSRTATGWVASPLAPPATQLEANTSWRFNADEDTALFSAPTPPLGEDDWWARRPDGSFQDLGPLSPPEQGPNFNAVNHTQGIAATADLSRIVFQSLPWPFSPAEPEGSNALFEYIGAGHTQPALVGVSGEGPANSELISACATGLGRDGTQPSTLSADGRIVYFTADAPNSTGGVACPGGTGANENKQVPVDELFARVDNGEPDAHTVAISQPDGILPAQPDPACSGACEQDITDETNWREAEYVDASADGSKAFFLSPQRLTDTATQDPVATDGGQACSGTTGANGCNLYEFEDTPAASPSERHLIDLSAGDTSGAGPQVQGVMAISTDGSHVYFVAKGVLTPAANAQGETAQVDQDNLYVFAGGHVAFIATLPEVDANEFSLGSPANVTPEGRFLVFTSSGALTPDVTRTDGARQVYRYDAMTGGLVRISIGEHGFNDNGNAGAGDASIVEGQLGYQRLGPGRSDPTMSDDGSYVFFMSPVALTAGALSSVRIGADEHGAPLYAQNVYEYHEGQVFLISDGRDTSVAPPYLCTPSISSVCLIGSDTSGHNVFFTTADRLLPQDTDTQLDFYDARICEPEHGNPCIPPPASTPPPCSGEECHGTPPATPSQSTPSSSIFNGAGNVTPPPPAAVKPKALTKAQKLAKALHSCRTKHRRSKKRRKTCERQVRRAYSARRSAHAGRRAHR